MKPEEIKLSDWARIFAGEVPGIFYVELIIRAAFVYLLIILSMRLLGKRMASQITRLELAALASLAAAIGVPMLAPDRGILPAIIIAAVVVSTTRLIARLGSRSEKFEDVTQGSIAILVEDSVLQMNNMQQAQITRERLLAQLRSEQVLHLGQVKRLYIEATGSFSIILQPESKPGLLVLPKRDREFIEQEVEWTDTIICHRCGSRAEDTRRQDTCTNCGEEEWTKGVTSKKNRIT